MRFIFICYAYMLCDIPYTYYIITPMESGAPVSNQPLTPSAA